MLAKRVFVIAFEHRIWPLLYKCELSQKEERRTYRTQASGFSATSTNRWHCHTCRKRAENWHVGRESVTGLATPDNPLTLVAKGDVTAFWSESPEGRRREISLQIWPITLKATPEF